MIANADSMLLAVQTTADDIAGTDVPEPNISGFTSGMADMAYSATSAVATVKSAIQSLNNLTVSYSGGKLFGGVSITPIPVPMAAEGGQFSTGQMFVAREDGIPEMVGVMGNKATVANNDQIVQGIAFGVASGQAEQNSLLRQQNDYLRQLLAKESTVRVEPSAGWGKFNRRSEEMYARNSGV